MFAIDTLQSKKTRDELEKMIREVEEIPTIPESLIQIMKVLDDGDSGPADLARAVRLDAPLMSKILRLANSPYYNSQGTLSDINRCVAVLGYRTVRQMALTVSVATSLVSAVADTQGRLDYRELWRHSVVVGAIAKELALLTNYRDPEEIFTIGLMHDIGKFILEIQDAPRYDRLIEERNRSGRSLVEMEREEFGFDHADIGEAFGRVWFLPEMLTSTIGCHHRPDVDRDLDSRQTQARNLVALADYLANTMAASRSDLGFDPSCVDPNRLNQAVNITLNDLEAHLPQIRDAVEMAADYLNLD